MNTVMDLSTTENLNLMDLSRIEHINTDSGPNDIISYYHFINLTWTFKQKTVYSDSTDRCEGKKKKPNLTMSNTVCTFTPSLVRLVKRSSLTGLHYTYISNHHFDMCKLLTNVYQCNLVVCNGIQGDGNVM